MKRFIKRLSITLVLLFVSVWLIIFFLPKPPLLSDISFSRAVYDSHHRLLRLTLSKDDKYRLFTPLSEISPQLVSATLLEEDQYYHWHYGVNPLALVKAMWQTYIAKTRRIGASTISMQVARMRFHIQSKHSLGKIWQIIRAFQLEMYYSKDQIIEAYLNLAPYGNNIEGVGAASLIYFGKPVKEVNLPQALTLSVIPQNPLQRTPSQKELKEIRNKLFNRWLAKHPEDKSKEYIVQLPLQLQTRQTLPFLAPHFVNSVLRDAPQEQQHIVTTLDLRLQKIVEYITQQYLVRKRNIGATNAAVLLIDTRDMGVKAWLGSANFFNLSIHGQINGVEAKRSPGSTLKPFIYGLALDQGIIHPNTVLKDVPHSFGHYNPENFDYDFMGPIKAKDALVLSRNIPAIDLAAQLSKPNLYELLQKAHIKNLKPESYYGLALVLGGMELSMQDLASLYSMLVNEGVWHPLRMQQNSPLAKGDRLLSPEASFLVLDMLQHTPRTEFKYAITNRQTPIAWKTGTSSGYRDAWTIGAFGPYVLAVWMGNFNNVGNHSFVGKNLAAPLFFELINGIHNEVGLPVSSKQITKLNLTHVPVCKVSGMLPSRYCHDTELTWFIPGKSPIKVDTVHREIPIDKKTGLRACQFANDTRFEIYEFWSSDLLAIFKSAGMQRRTPPPFNPDCFFTKEIGFSPHIISPRSNLSYVLSPHHTDKLIVPFKAVVDADVSFVHWFLNDVYLGKVARDQAFLWYAKAGKFVVRAVDDHGRSDSKDVVIKINY